MPLYVNPYIEKISVDKLNKYFIYEESTGKLFNRIVRNSSAIGRESGHLTRFGYRRVQIKGKTYATHRIVWLMCKGYWPKFIDHINGNREDNRLENLREVITCRENCINMEWHRNGRLVGASRGAGQVKYQSQITHKDPITGKRVCVRLGGFDTELEAHEAYMKAYREKLLNIEEIDDDGSRYL